MPIKSFKCEDTRALFLGQRIARWINIERPALRKLEQLDWSAVLKDLRVPPGNRLEALKGRRKGQYSIRRCCVSEGLCEIFFREKFESDHEVA